MERYFLSLFLAAVLGACASLPGEYGSYPQDSAPDPAESGSLASLERTLGERHGTEVSGFRLLDRNADALDWRLALLDSAESSLDILYYLWYGDESGRLVLKRVLKAADRGVSVRLMVDDLLLIGNDAGLVAIDHHPNIALRLFNPKRQRRAGMVVDTLSRFEQMNARTHNKLIVADNRAVILGGRNIGDYYFGLNRKYNFHDLDVLGFGPVARQSSELFDNFWNSDWVVQAADLPASIDAQEIGERREKLRHDLESSDALEAFGVDARDWSESFENLLPELHVGSSTVIFDRFEDGELVRGMADPLGKALRSAESDIRVTNAYIIPGEDFVNGIRELAEKGVSIRILTNSLASHDVPAVNSHYGKWRRPIIEAGAELYEFRHDPAIKSRVDTKPVSSKFSGLHTKSFVVDGQTVFIGSMNFDPRSAAINTEMGVIIESAGLGAEMIRLAERDMAPENAWRVLVNDDGDLSWVNSDESVSRQPARSFWQRCMDVVFKLLPKSQL